MGAALHLAVVREPFPTSRHPSTKRTGPGGGNGYDALVEKIYRDRRLGSDVRDLALCLAWLIAKDPQRGNGKSVWERATEIFGLRSDKTSNAAHMLATDLPLYSPPMPSGMTCAAPMVRREGLCGRRPLSHTWALDETTNGRVPVPYCEIDRHRAWADEQTALYREAQKTAPEPIPNRGGLLPCFLTLNEEGWVQNYRWAAQAARVRWQPPSYGIRRDQWPGYQVPEHAPAPRLKLVQDDGHLLRRL